MSFSSVLDAYCSALNCTNAVIAKECGISPSALSRYRNGSRLPTNKSEAICNLARGISSLSQRGEADEIFTYAEVAMALDTARRGLHIAGSSFGERLDQLMTVVGMRNTELARIAKIDPSYLSRIRNGQRTPAEREFLAQMCASLAAHWCIYNNEIDRLTPFIKQAESLADRLEEGFDIESMLAEDIQDWLLGEGIEEADITEMKRFFDWLENHDFAQSTTEYSQFYEMEEIDLTPRAVFRYGVEDMRATELEFLDIAAYTKAPHVLMTSDVPVMKTTPDVAFTEDHMKKIGHIVQRGGKVSIIHTIDRPISEVLTSLRQWIPLYVTGRVTPYYLRGMRSRLFCHVNCVCNSCAMSSEAVIGHQDEGRYYLTLLPEDIAYYQRKMEFVLEKASSLLEVYLADVPGDFEAFAESERSRQMNESKREVCAGMYKNVRIMMYPGDCIVISLLRDPKAHLVIRHPKLRYAISVMN